MDLFLSGAWAEEAAETAEAAAEAVTETAAEPGYFAQLTEKFAESSLSSWIAVAVLVALGIAFFMIA